MQAGLDSLGAVELRNSIAESFRISVPATVAFDYPTKAALEGFIIQNVTPQPPSDSIAEPGVETSSRHLDTSEVEAKIIGIAAGIIGGAVSREQPLMEVRFEFLLGLQSTEHER